MHPDIIYFNLAEYLLSEFLISMNKRQEAKYNTHKKIIKSAKEIFTQNGVLNSTTKEIAVDCGIAHGTLFMHFENKETLIAEIFTIELKRIGEEMYQISNKSSELETLIDLYFDFLEKDEDFLSVIYKEFPFYSKALQRKILSIEIIIRNFFYNSIESGIRKNKYKELKITTTLSFLFGTLNYYIRQKEIFIESGSVIKSKRESIKETFFNLINKEK